MKIFDHKISPLYTQYFIHDFGILLFHSPAYSTEVTYESVGSSGQIDNGGGEQSHQYSVPSHTARDRVLTNANESYNVVSPDHHYALPQAKPPVAAVASPIE